MFPDEYNQFCRGMIDKREIQNTQFASMSTGEMIKQFVYEIPLTLHNILEDSLDLEDKQYLKTQKGAEWFARTHKDFSPAASV